MTRHEPDWVHPHDDKLPPRPRRNWWAFAVTVALTAALGWAIVALGWVAGR